MRQIWHQAADLLATAVAAGGSDSSQIALLIDGQNGLRIVDASGWHIDALQREYGAQSAYTVTRNHGTVVVEAQTRTERCTLTQGKKQGPVMPFLNGIPHHLVCPPQPLLT